ncbi:hypothetical protein [Vibrio aestuarianus]|uniref:hypothetical protein n=1 Tax=Vibrio aestuarianus TaxID=28171 RepID=UPI00237CBDBF|nr:hypothetical protein [Vibrio aestuarianus]MDE1222024.1 hypothetical protein [Vibrio aestuarianus]MDE1239785.1 hypothetical protein [Vibrio aestuarianus]
MNKINKFKFSLLLSMMSASVFAANPPSSEIMELNIYQDSGEGHIYANNNMQAEIYISYEIAMGAVVKSITLRNANTLEKLEDIYGWSVDSYGNNYPHVIGQSSRNMVVQDNTVIKRYVRSSVIDNVDICVDLELTTGESKSTCQTSPSVSVQAIQPIRYSSNDFNLELIAKTVDDSNRSLFQYSLIVKNPSYLLPLKVKNALNVNDYGPSVYHVNAVDATAKAYRSSQSSASVSAFVLKPNDFTHVQFYGNNAAFYAKELRIVNDQTLATIIHYAPHRGRILVERELECYNIDSNYWNCAGVDLGQWVRLGDSFIKHHMRDTLPGRVQFEDLYGNTGEVLLHYPNGGAALTLL